MEEGEGLLAYALSADLAHKLTEPPPSIDSVRSLPPPKERGRTTESRDGLRLPRGLTAGDVVASPST